MDTRISSFLTIRSTNPGVTSALKDLAEKVIIGFEPKPEGSEDDMASRKKTETSMEYDTAAAKFILRLKEDQQRTAKDVLVAVDYEEGRRYDKVIVSELKEGKRYNPHVRYFIDRETGEIFGAKSPTAPNERHFFNTVYTADKWDWSGYYGKPVSDDTVVAKKSYGLNREKRRGGPVYVHYERVGTQHSDDPPNTPTPTEELVEA